MDLTSVDHETKKDLPQLVSGWSNEDYFLLLKMYTDNCAPTTIAVHFNKTRGQIAGLLHRAKQNGLIEGKRIFKPKAEKLPKPDPVEKVNKLLAQKLLNKLIVKRVRKQRRVRLRLIDHTNEVTFAELEPHHCRWGIGDPRNTDFRFCGCRRELTRPYCAAHVIKAGRMYEKPQAPRTKVRPSYRR